MLESFEEGEKGLFIKTIVGESKSMIADRIKDQLKKAGITNIDVIYDPEDDKVRYYKRALAYEAGLEDNLLTVVHRLGWHRFE